MKLLKLRLKNLNSFRQEVNLDFEAPPMNETSLLAITGPTGSGKTTLLDALCVALYNKTPRLSGIGNQNPGNLLSQGKDEGFSEVIFEADGTRYLAEWRVRRTRKGELRTSAKLAYADTGEPITDRLAPRGKSDDIHDMSVSGAVGALLRLEFDAFNRSVMLAQGQFAAFLKAKAEERRAILEATTGIAIYDTLKKALNERVSTVKREYEREEATFNAIPTASEEEVEQVRTQLEKSESEAQTMVQNRREIMAEKDAESQRVRTYGQLIKAEERQRTLLSQRAEFDALQSELDAARRAAALRPEQQAFSAEARNLDAAETAFTEAQGQFDDAENAFDQRQKRLAKIAEDHRAAEADHETRMAELNEARDEEIRAQAQFDAAEKRTEELKAVQETINQLTQALAAQEKEKTELAEGIESDRAFLSANPLPADSDQRLLRAKTLRATLHGKVESHSEKVKTQNELQSKMGQLQRAAEDLAQAQVKLIEEKQIVDDAVAQTEAELNAQLEIGDEAKWLRQKREAQQLQPIAGAYENAVDGLSAAQEELGALHQTLDSVTCELADRNRALESGTQDLALAEEQVNRYEAEEKYALMANHVAALRQALQADEPCRVCGATAHPWADKEESEGEKQIESARRQLAESKAVLQAEQKRISDLQRQRDRAEADQADLDRRCTDLLKTIAASEAAIAASRERWGAMSASAEISSQSVQALIEEADRRIDDLHQAKTAYSEALNGQKLIQQRLDSHMREAQSVETQLKEIEQQRQIIKREIAVLSGEIAGVETQFSEALPESFHGAAPEEALDQFEERLNAVKACEKRLNDEQGKLNRIAAEIEGVVKQLQSERRRSTSIEAEISQYQAEGDRLLASARTKTNGQTAETAIQNLVAELRRKTEARDLEQEACRKAETQLIQTRSKKDSANAHRDACRQNFNVAQHAYLNVLADGGFASPQEHERAFREAPWLKTTETKIQQYQRDLDATIVQVEEHREIFADAPFDPETMERIQQAEQDINTRIDANAQEVGSLREKRKKLQETLKRRQAQADVLEKARREKDRWERLQKHMPENSLRDFALERMFDLMIRLANKQLEDLTHRYELKVKGMRDMVVVDRWNANEERPVETLSGGESFLTSLSLALALSEMSRGRTQLHSLFLDEGFGTLDTQTLDVAISALEGLRLAGRSVVVISHVGELTRRIPVRIAVEKTGSGSSMVRVLER